MPDPTLLAPSTGNLTIGKGVASFKKTGAADYVDLGNCPEVVLTPDLETLEHFTSRSGVKTKDLVVVLTKSAQIKVTMEEVTSFNMSLMLMGDVDNAAVGGPRVEIFSLSTLTGAFKFVGENDIGAQVTMELWNVSLVPSGDFGLISDEWNNFEITGDVLIADTGPNVGQFGYVQITNIPGVS